VVELMRNAERVSAKALAGVVHVAWESKTEVGEIPFTVLYLRAASRRLYLSHRFTLPPQIPRASFCPFRTP